MFGTDDAFVIPLAGLLHKFPVFPMFGDGKTMLQPACVEDVGEAIARMFDAEPAPTVFELGGPRTYTYAALLKAIGRQLNVSRILIPVPFAIWHALALVAEFVPKPLITRNQVELMTVDNVASPGSFGFAALGIEPRGLETVLPQIAK
jgi:NADH dehydrogenase